MTQRGRVGLPAVEDVVGDDTRPPLSPSVRRALVLAAVAMVAAVALVLGAYRMGVAAGAPKTADFAALDDGLAVALGVTAAQVRDDRDYRQYERPGCQTGTCRQVTIGPVPPPASVVQARLYDAGWVLHSHDEPECVSDGPGVTGSVCSYELDDVTVSIQTDSPDATGELYVWASTG